MVDEEQGCANVANRISSSGHEIPKAYGDTKKKSSTVEGELDRGERLDEDTMNISTLNSKKSLIAWLVLCYSTGPTSAVAFTYISASIQTLANVLGHIPGSRQKCAKRGHIKCVVRFGAGEVDYNSYLLYLQAIGRVCEGVLAIVVSSIADYSHYRKALMIASICAFGVLALPFAGLNEVSYRDLIASSGLFCALTTVQAVYQMTESSYIPLFMRSASRHPTIAGQQQTTAGVRRHTLDASSPDDALVKGSQVSVMGIVAGNVGSLTALLIGIVITYTRGSALREGYGNFLLAITIAGCLTLVFALLGGCLLPSVPGKPLPRGNIARTVLRRWINLILSIRRYPNAFKLCIGWILWYTATNNFNSVVGLLFREVSGLGSGDAVYTVWTFTNILFACAGSLTWMFIFARTNWPVKMWAYLFISVHVACALWGTIGISSNVGFGYKHVAEFWVEQILFATTTSALRSYNRMLYSSMIPHGAETQFFGLEITLDLATGWINPLLQGTIQNRTHNLRFPMIPNLILLLVALGFYAWVDVEKGKLEAKEAMKK